MYNPPGGKPKLHIPRAGASRMEVDFLPKDKP